MRRPNTVRLVLAATAALLVAAPVHATEGSTRSERHQLSGREVTIFNVAGNVVVEPGSGEMVVVEVARHGVDAARIQPRTDVDDYRTNLAFRFPADQVRYAGAEAQPIHVRLDGKFGAGFGGEAVGFSSSAGLDARADLVVRVPAGKRLSLVVGAGDVTVRGTAVDLRVQLANGRLEVADTQGSLWVRTGTADVALRNTQGRLNVESKSGDLTLEQVKGERMVARTETGKVVVQVDKAASTELSARTGSGRIESRVPEFPAAAEQRSLFGRTGDGSSRLEVESARGDIQVVGV